MISKKTIKLLNATALVLAAIVIVLAGLHLFHHKYLWIEYSIVGVAVTLSIVASTARMRQRWEQKQIVKAARASLLKQEWELRHEREW